MNMLEFIEKAEPNIIYTSYLGICIWINDGGCIMIGDDIKNSKALIHKNLILADWKKNG